MLGRSARAALSLRLLVVVLVVSIFLEACGLFIGLEDRSLPVEEDASADAGRDSGTGLVDAPADAPASDAADAGDANDGAVGPGTLTSASVVLGSTAAGATGSVVLAFTTSRAWPLDGTFDVVFPAGFDVSGATFVSQVGSSGTFSLSKSGQLVTLTRSGGTATNGAVTLTLGTITNPFTSGATGTFTFTTRANGGAVIDTATGIAGPTIAPAGLGSPSVSPVDLSAGALGNVDVAFTTVNPLPATGTIEVTFPAGFDVSGATFVSQTGSDGVFTPGVAGQVVSIVRSGGTATNGAVSVRLGSIRNPRVSGATGTYGVRTLAAGGAAIDTANAPSTNIVAGALTSTSVTPQSLTVGVSGNVVVALTPTNPWPADGKLDVVFPAGFDVSTATFVSNVGSSGGFAISIAAQTVTLTRDGAGTPTGGAFSVTLGSIRNPGSAITVGSSTLTTRTNGGAAIDTGTAVGMTFTAGALSSTSVTPSSLVAGASGNVVIALTTATSWPADGKIDFTFPAGFAVASATFVSQSGSNGGFTASVAGQTVTLTRNGAGTATPGGALAFTLGGIMNPSISGTTSTFSLATQSSASAAIDTGTAAGVAITPGALTTVSAAPASNTASASGNFTASFTLANPWPADGRFEIVFPAGFDVSGATFNSATGAIGGFSLSVAGQTVTVIRNGAGTTTAAATAVTITLGGIVNPSISGTTSTFSLATRSGTSLAIDTGTAAGVSIVGALTAVSAAPASTTANAQGNFTASFTLASAWPADGRFQIVFPAGFDVSGANFDSATGADGGFAVSVAGQTVTLIRNGAGTNTAAATAVTITLGTVVNPAAAGMTASYSLTTRNTSSVTIDTGTAAGTNITP